MDIRPKTSAVLAKILVRLFVLIMLTLFLMKPPLTLSTASVQGEAGPGLGAKCPGEESSACVKTHAKDPGDQLRGWDSLFS